MRRHPWDALRFDVTVAGGLTPSRKLVALAEGAGLWAELQSWGYTLIQAANLHLGLGVAGTGMFELPVPAEPHEYGVRNPYTDHGGRPCRGADRARPGHRRRLGADGQPPARVLHVQR